MELSEQTIGVLRNYASINPNIVETGNKLKLFLLQEMFCLLLLSQKPSEEFGIYDLGEF